MSSCHGSHQSHPPALRLQFRGAFGPLFGRGAAAPCRERAPGERQRLPQVRGSARGAGGGWGCAARGARLLDGTIKDPGGELATERHVQDLSGPARDAASFPGMLLIPGGLDLEQLRCSRAGPVLTQPGSVCCVHGAGMPQTCLLWAVLGVRSRRPKQAGNRCFLSNVWNVPP